MNTVEIANKEYLDLYESSLADYVEMPANSTFEDIVKQVETNTTVGYKHKLVIAGRCVIAERRYTWRGNVAKTSYLHILRVKSFDNPIVLEHWREQKDGNFKTI